ncbi:MAG: hypothetical protein AABX11_06325 [Nanoarchaeota archaeon]
MELMSLNEVSVESKILLLRGLGLGGKEGLVVDAEGKKILDRYLQIPVKIDNMVIFPGSTIVLDNNELSITMYMEEFGEDALG